MYKNKIDLNSLNSGMSSVKLKELLMDYRPCQKLSREVLKALQPDEKLNETLRKLLNENPHIFEISGSFTSKALANREKNRQLPYILFREYLNKQEHKKREAVIALSFLISVLKVLRLNVVND